MRPNLATRAFACLVLGMGVVAADGASAQRSARRPPPDEPPRISEYGRGRETYSVPRGYTGTITANTPNEWGNLGGPSSGGGGGGNGGR